MQLALKNMLKGHSSTTPVVIIPYALFNAHVMLRTGMGSTQDTSQKESPVPQLQFGHAFSMQALLPLFAGPAGGGSFGGGAGESLQPS
jgi:hypothetical protein